MRKFAFDLSFDDPDPRQPLAAEVAAIEALAEVMAEEVPPPPPTFSAEELQAARAAAYSDGEAAGRMAAESGLLARQNRWLEGVAARLEQLQAAAESARNGLEADAVRVAVAVVQALYPHSFHEEARQEIVHALHQVLETHEETTKPLTLTIAEADQEWALSLLETLGSQRVRVRALSELTPGDFRLEWADGGLERRQADIWARIAALVPPNPSDNTTETDHKETNP